MIGWRPVWQVEGEEPDFFFHFLALQVLRESKQLRAKASTNKYLRSHLKPLIRLYSYSYHYYYCPILAVIVCNFLVKWMFCSDILLAADFNSSSDSRYNCGSNMWRYDWISPMIPPTLAMLTRSFTCWPHANCGGRRSAGPVIHRSRICQWGEKVLMCSKKLHILKCGNHDKCNISHGWVFFCWKHFAGFPGFVTDWLLVMKRVNTSCSNIRQSKDSTCFQTSGSINTYTECRDDELMASVSSLLGKTAVR